MPCNVGSLVGSQKAHRASHVLRRANTSQRNIFYGGLLEFLAQRCGHAGFYESWSDRITSYIARGYFSGYGHGQADQSGFRGGVIGLAGLSYLAEDAGDVD